MGTKTEGPRPGRSATPQWINTAKTSAPSEKKQARAADVLARTEALCRTLLHNTGRHPRAIDWPTDPVNRTAAVIADQMRDHRRKGIGIMLAELFGWRYHWRPEFGPHNVLVARNDVRLARRPAPRAFANAEGFTAPGRHRYRGARKPAALLVHPVMRRADALDDIAEFGLDAFTFGANWYNPYSAVSVLAVSPDYSAPVVDVFRWAQVQLTEHWPVRVGPYRPRPLSAELTMAWRADR